MQEKKQAFSKMITLLARKSYTSFEIRKKLEPLFPREEIEEAIEICVKYGYIDDDREKERTEEKLIERGKSPLAIKYALLKRFGTFVEVDGDEMTAIQKAVKKLGVGKSKEAIIRALYQRGFSFDAIQKVVGDRFSEEV